MHGNPAAMAMAISVQQALAVVRSHVCEQDGSEHTGLRLALICLETGLLDEEGRSLQAGGIKSRKRQA